MTSAPLVLDLVRHGEVATPGLLCAGPDEPLSARGAAQLARLAQGPQWDLVISSPAMRCREYGEKIAIQRGIPCLADEAFREIDLGEWSGRTTESIWQTDSEQLMRLWSSPETFTSPGGEAMADFIGRVENAAQSLYRDYPSRRILLLTHAGVIRVIVAQLLGITAQNVQKLSVGHGRINRVCIYPDGQVSLLHWGGSPLELANA